MNLYRLIVASTAIVILFSLTLSARAEKGAGIDLPIATRWEMDIDYEQRSGEESPRYRISGESPTGPGHPRLLYWPVERQGKDGLPNWYGLNFTTANFNDRPWLRMGLGGSQERESSLIRRPDSEFYLTLGYYSQENLFSNLRLVGDVELRYQLVDRMGLDLCIHQLGILYQTGRIEFGPTLCSKHWTEEDFLALGFLIGYRSRSTELTVEFFSNDVDWKIKGSYGF
jgi:hypothetical protein